MLRELPQACGDLYDTSTHWHSDNDGGHCKIMVELLSVLALASKQIEQGRLSRYAFTFKCS